MIILGLLTVISNKQGITVPKKRKHKGSVYFFVDFLLLQLNDRSYRIFTEGMVMFILKIVIDVINPFF